VSWHEGSLSQSKGKVPCITLKLSSTFPYLTDCAFAFKCPKAVVVFLRRSLYQPRAMADTIGGQGSKQQGTQAPASSMNPAMGHGFS
jgi:hypothetical protein